MLPETHVQRTCTLVPAFAGSMPALAKPKGSMVPINTDEVTIRNRDKEIAKEFSRLPSVRNTRMKPPAVCSADDTAAISKGMSELKDT